MEHRIIETYRKPGIIKGKPGKDMNKDSKDYCDSINVDLNII